MPALRLTGTNNIPLGTNRLSKIGASTAQSTEIAIAPDPHVIKPSTKVRTSQSRWGSSERNQILDLLNLSAALTTSMTPEQLEAYATHLRIQEITQCLQIHAVVPSRRARSPSPTPTYDNTGRRTNTREARYRRKLEDERHVLIEKAIKFIPEYKPPSDYKRPSKSQDKIYIPVREHPEIRFIGLILGPRGKYLKEIEEKTGARVFIRGKGSVKEGKVDRHNDCEEDLHCLVLGDSEASVVAGVAEIQEIIETATTTPERENKRKQDQMRDIAVINGTFRDDENRTCRVCGKPGHIQWDCPERDSGRPLANIVCHRCKQPGHLQRDCKANLRRGVVPKGQFDQEYQDLMNDLGLGKAIGSSASHAPAQIEATPANAPWRKQPAAVVGPPPPPIPAPVVASSAPGVSLPPPFSRQPPWLTSFPQFSLGQQSSGAPPALPTTNVNGFPLAFQNIPPPLPPAMQPRPPAYPPPPVYG
jgi:splicing factor 1